MLICMGYLFRTVVRLRGNNDMDNPCLNSLYGHASIKKVV